MDRQSLTPDRSNLLGMLAEEEIVRRYRDIWGDGVGLAEAKAHAALEGELTDLLLRSAPEARASLFEQAYGRLYRELPWLNAAEPPAADAADLQAWSRLVGRGHRILEIGSGHGFLIRHLARQGNECFASEVTDQRGEKPESSEEGVRWIQADAVHLSRTVAPESVDVVISDQVFEHLHPDDHARHLQEIRAVLAPGGRYILRAPHRSAGPADVSSVFGFDRAVFMHLCEPDHLSIHALARDAGFRDIAAVFNRKGVTFASKTFLRYQMSIDAAERKLIRRQTTRRHFRKLCKKLLVNDFVWVAARK